MFGYLNPEVFEPAISDIGISQTLFGDFKYLELDHRLARGYFGPIIWIQILRLRP